jgi:hypothetical protein
LELCRFRGDGPQQKKPIKEEQECAPSGGPHDHHGAAVVAVGGCVKSAVGGPFKASAITWTRGLSISGVIDIDNQLAEDALLLHNRELNPVERFTRYLDSEGLERRTVLADGNCLFRALCVALGLNENGHILMRERVAQYIADNFWNFEALTIEMRVTNVYDYPLRRYLPIAVERSLRGKYD